MNPIFCRAICALVVVSLLAVTSSFALTAAPPTTYEVELMVPEGKETVATDADIIFNDNGLKVVPDKPKFNASVKEFSYGDIKHADHSFSKKPMLSGGGAVATALLVGFIFAIPFLFMKKKSHWVTIQTDKEFAVIKLGDMNWRSVIAELKTKGVTVNDLKEEGK